MTQRTTAGTPTSGGAVTLRVTGTDEEIEVRPAKLVVAGYTGRDEAAVAEHIRELEAIGIPAPPSVPTFYDLDPALLTTGPTAAVSGAATSGEVEPVVIRHDGRYFLGVGSDHTDRELERTSIHGSKAACAKPVGPRVAEIGTDLPGLPWDEITAESHVDGAPYQRGVIAALRHPADTAERMTAALGEITGDLVLFCGTLPLLDGTFVHGTRWRLRLGLPDGTELTHAYQAQPADLPTR
ncbi:DUF2848 family protein [Streptomyces sp. SBT349]|uniref:DUF2848 family protein n=1 Tax=Streptomyces sp. SBT349 TaxID=1580539 RepID=UPI00069F5ECA|nr:DUF2848 family protein [Streptomyces sp. SBT349]